MQLCKGDQLCKLKKIRLWQEDRKGYACNVRLMIFPGQDISLGKACRTNPKKRMKPSGSTIQLLLLQGDTNPSVQAITGNFSTVTMMLPCDKTRSTTFALIDKCNASKSITATSHHHTTDKSSQGKYREEKRLHRPPESNRI